MSATPTAIVLGKLSAADHEYPSAVAGALERLGWQVHRLGLEQLEQAEDPDELVAGLIAEHQPEALFSINFFGLMARLSLELGFRYVCWTEIHPVVSQVSEWPEDNDIWCFEPSTFRVEALAERNLHARFWPMGYDDRYFWPDEPPREELAVSFVGNGLGHVEAIFREMLGGLRSARRASEDEGQRLLYERALSFCRLVRQLPFAELEGKLGCSYQRLAEGFVSTQGDLGDEAQRGLLEWAYGVYEPMGAYLARKQRIETLARVAATCGDGLRIFGQDWHGTKLAACAGEPLPFAETREIFARSAISVNVQRFYADNVNDRLFNVPASGGFLLNRHTDDSAAVLADGEEFVSFGDLDDLEQKLSYYLGHPEERRRIAAAGQRRVRAEYPLTRRLWGLLGECDLPRPATFDDAWVDAARCTR